MKHINFVSFGFSCMIMAGMTLDGWAHAHGATDNTFFTPWHAVLYSGMLGSTLWYGWLLRQHIPPLVAHRLGFALLPIVGICGAADFIWHTVYGFEIDISAQMSPPHIVLACVIATLVSIPSHQRDANGRLTLWGSISGGLAATMMLTLTQFMSPLSSVYAELYSGDTARGLGVTGFLIFAGAWMLVLLWMRRQHAPRGAFVLASMLLGITQACISDEWRFVPLLVVTSLLCEYLFAPENVPYRRILYCWAVSFSLGYFGILHYQQSLAWSPSIWGGVVIMTLGIAYGLSALQAERPPHQLAGETT